MDGILPQLLAFPPHPPPTTPLVDGEYDRQINAVVDLLNKTPASSLVGGVKGGGDLLDILDPSINTLPYLYVLLAHIGNTRGKQTKNAIAEVFSPGQDLWKKMLLFVERFDAVQVRYGGHQMRRLFQLTALRARQLDTPAAAIPPIGNGILRIDPSSSTLTSSHLELVTLVLESRAWSLALPVLDLDIYFFPAPSETHTEQLASLLSPYLCSNHDSSSTFITAKSGLSNELTYRDHLQYFLYAGMIYIGLKEWERAQSMLEIVIASPTSNNASKIQVEAFKKWVLVGLLRKGAMPSLPKTVSSSINKAFQGLAKPYIGLAEIFKEGVRNEESATRVLTEAQAGHEIFFGPDMNIGLIRQVVDAYRISSVQHLSQTYAAMTITEITRRTSPDPKDLHDTGHFVTGLISSGALNASISQPSEDPASWVVNFNCETKLLPSEQTEEQQYLDLKRQAGRIKTLMNQVAEADRQLGLSEAYIKEARKARKFEAEGGDDEHGPQHVGAAGNDMDEDMMADL